MKKCTKCGEVKALSEFALSKSGAGGRHSQCKKCRYAYMIKWRKNNPDLHLASVAKYGKKFPERVANYRKKSQAKSILNLEPSYVAVLLGISLSELTDELLELKREQLKIHRAVKQLNKEIQNATE